MKHYQEPITWHCIYPIEKLRCKRDCLNVRIDVRATETINTFGCTHEATQWRCGCSLLLTLVISLLFRWLYVCVIWKYSHTKSDAWHIEHLSTFHKLTNIFYPLKKCKRWNNHSYKIDPRTTGILHTMKQIQKKHRLNIIYPLVYTQMWWSLKWKLEISNMYYKYW